MTLINLQVQFPDVTEIVNSYQLANFSKVSLCEEIPTEFAFATTACTITTKIEEMKMAGFAEISAMNNWWPTHSSTHRKISFWWRRMRTEGIKEITASRKSCGYGTEGTLTGYHNPYLQKSGCGFKLAEPPLLRKQFFRYFTMLRMPLAITPNQKRWLTACNFHKFDDGEFASFWINGWPPETYTYAEEAAFFKAKGVSLDAQNKAI